MSTSLTARDEQILETLTTKIRVLSLDQIARTWWGQARAGASLAARRLSVLGRTGLLTFEPLWSRPELPLSKPLFSWQPGMPPPDCAHLSTQAVARWREAAIRIPCAF